MLFRPKFWIITILIFIIIFMINLHFSECIEMEYIKENNIEIISLNREKRFMMTGKGSFFIGIGSIKINGEDKDYYYFYKVIEKNTFILDKLDVFTTKIIESDTIKPTLKQKIKIIKRDYKYSIYRDVYTESIIENILIVPKNTIIRKIEL